MVEPLKYKAVSGITWSFLHRFGIIFISFVSNLLLARLLEPNDFGYVGMLMVFIAVSESLVNSGFDSALIQKKSPTLLDYSTVFYFNLLVSIVLYLVIFICADIISSFYKLSHLSGMLKLLGIVIIINSFSIVQNNQFQKKMNFNKLAIVDIISASISTFVGIILALKGYGVWSLIIKTLVGSSCRTLLFWILSNWRPIKAFSFISLRELFSFGGLIFLADMGETIVNQLISLIIGKRYSSEKLGYFNQAQNLQRIPETTIPFVIARVFFPLFSSIQDDMEKIRNIFRRSQKALTFINFPVMILMVLIAKEIIIILYTEKWLGAVGYFQLLCVGGMLYSLNVGIITLLKSLGKGKIFLWVSIMKRLTSLILIILGSFFGIYGIVAGWVIGIYAAFLINAYYIGKIIRYRLAKQIKDVLPIYFISYISGLIVILFIKLVKIESNILSICIKSLIYLSIYIIFSYLIEKESFKSYINLINDFIKKLKIKSAA